MNIDLKNYFVLRVWLNSYGVYGYTAAIKDVGNTKFCVCEDVKML